MAISQTITDVPTPPSSSDSANFRTRADAFMASLDTLSTELNTYATQANSLEANVNNLASSAEASKNAAAVSELNAQASANFKGSWSGATAYTTGQSVLGSDNAFYVALQNSTNQNPTSTTGYWKINVPLGAIGNINSPLLDMPLKNSLAMKAGVGSATFTRASTATYIDRYGVLKTAAIDEPRFEKEGYLNEGASTNLLTYSDQFDNAAWGKNETTIVANTTEVLDPYGTNLADKLTNSGGTTSLIWENITVPSSLTTSYAASVFCKAGSLTRITLNPYYQGEAEYNIHFEFSTKTFTGIPAGGSASYTELANGWFRLVVVMPYSTTGATTLYYRIWPDRLTATAGGYHYVFGAQLEALPFATSYIPTVASTVTRSADILKVTFENNTIGYKDRFSEETLAVDYRKFANNVAGALFTTELDNTSYRFYVGSSYVIGQYGSDSVGGSQLASPTVQNYVKNRFILTHDVAGVTKMYTNGVLSATGTSGTSNSTGTPTALWIGSNGGYYHAFGHITDFRIYNKSLTSQEAALA